MKIPDELKEEIEDLLKDNPKLRGQVLAGNTEAIHEIVSIGQEKYYQRL